MGGWVATLVALLRPSRVAALLLVAPALDISEHFWGALTQEQKDKVRARMEGRNEAGGLERLYFPSHKIDSTVVTF